MDRKDLTPIAYSINEAAKVSGLSRTTLYKLMKTDELPYRVVAGKRMIARSALVRLLDPQPSASVSHAA